ncbi:MAG: hypothetical protein M3264_14745 [Thermoproteota archaeon]|nr:hypothetical protein [Thermoproteota archaeon]
MPPNITKDEIEKLNDSQDFEGSKKKTTEKSKITTKASTFDLTKAGSTSTGIIDILDNPDVAVWSKGVMNKTSKPADKVQEPNHIKSTTTHIEYREGEAKQSHLQQTVDPANKEDVAKAIDLGTSLSDEATSLVNRSKKATSSEE